MIEINEKIFNSLTPDQVSQINSAGLTMGSDMINKMVDVGFDSSKTSLKTKNLRTNPGRIIRKNYKAETGKNLIKGAVSGAAAGTAFMPGIGTAVGAGIGLLTGAATSILGKSKNDEMASEAEKQRDNEIVSYAKDYINKTSYKNGGEVNGKGGPKDDKIKMTAKDGSFIVPAENAETAKQLGIQYLGWDDNTSASRNNGGKHIKVSDGEVLFTPEEKGILRYHGVNLDDLAPKAKEEKTKTNFSTGGGVKGNPSDEELYDDFKFDDKTGRVVDSQGYSYDDGNVYDQEGNKIKSNDLSASTIFNSNKPVMKENEDNPLDQSVDNSTKEEDEKGFNKKWHEYAPELASGIQMLGGMSGLISAGKKPDLSVSDSLKKLSADVNKLSQYGYEPSVLNALETQIERTRRDTNKAVTDSGGSPMEQMAKLQNVLSTTLDKKASIIFADAQEKARKYSDKIRVDTLKAGQEFDINKINFEDFYRTQDVFAGLLNSGIQNLIGARQYKAEQDAIKKIGTNAPTINLKTS